MPFTYEVNGQEVDFDKEPTEQDIDEAAQQLGGLPTQATKEQYLGAGERLSGGFRTTENLQQVREQQRAERGVAPETPLEPTGFNLENLKDLPLDILDAIGPAFPAIGQIGGGLLGGLATTPTVAGIPQGVIAGGIAGAGVGEAARQAIGQMLGFEQGSVGERLGKIGIEAGVGALGEGAAVGANALIRATKAGIIKASKRLIVKGGLQKAATIWGQITRNMDPQEIHRAIKLIESGDDAILGNKFAGKEAATTFVDELFFGTKDFNKRNLSLQIKKLGNSPTNRTAIKNLYKSTIGLSDEAFEQSINKGGSLRNFLQDGNAVKMAENIQNKLAGPQGLFEKMGSELGKARRALGIAAKEVDVTQHITSVNSMLADELVNVGYLNRTSTQAGDIFFENPMFVKTSSGSQIKKLFGKFIEDFFTPISKIPAGTKIPKGIVSKAITPYKSMKFGEFIDTLKVFDVQIAGSEFKGVAKLSNQLREYLSGLRGITRIVDKQHGSGVVGDLTDAFRDMMEAAAPLRAGNKIKNARQIEITLRKFANVKDLTGQEEARSLSSFLERNVGFDFLDRLKSFKSAREISEIEQGLRGASSLTKMESVMRNSFKESNTRALQTAQAAFDPFLPESLKIAKHAERITLSQKLHESAVSLLKARFISSSLGVPGMIGALGIIGGGGAVGGGLGLIGGFALQNPKLYRALLKASAGSTRRINAEIIEKLLKDVSRTKTVAGIQTLKSLLRNQNK